MKLNDFAAIIGGIAGDGINEAGLTVARLFNRLGYRIFMYYDYPSLIRGGHNFAIVRASSHKIGVHTDRVDVLIALNQETLERHKERMEEGSFLIYDLDRVKPQGLEQKGFGIPVASILKEEGAPPIMRNTCILGGFCRLAGIDWAVLEDVLRKHPPRKLEQNLLVARRGYDHAVEFCRMERLDQKSLPLMTGNQAAGLGLTKAGLGAYVAYPMTPSSALLDFMARSAPDFGLKVVHPENEIAVMLIAQGFAYAGVKAAIGTSGGGFCLMTEGLSLAGMSETPVVIMMGQRTGPSTGLPTYTAQGDLNFILNAGQGEFPRFVVSPGDAGDAYYWSGVALNMAWKYQVPSFILSDKMVCESVYSFDREEAGDPKEELPLLWDGKGKYNRYMFTDTGVSPLAFPPQKGQQIKANSYVHDESGITSEEPAVTAAMADKRLEKGRRMASDLEGYETVKILADGKGEKGKAIRGAIRGARDLERNAARNAARRVVGDEVENDNENLDDQVNESEKGEERTGNGGTALLCWGSNKDVCREAAEMLGLKVVQVLVLSPFPAKRLKEALAGVDRVIAVECNATGQLAALASLHGIPVQEQILKYDGRPFSLDGLQAELRRALA